MASGRRTQGPLSSLEAKLTGVIAGLALGISLVLAVYLPLRQVDRLRLELDRKALTVSRLTSHQVESAIAFGDRETAREVFEAVMLDPDVAGLSLLTDDGRTFYARGKVAAMTTAPVGEPRLVLAPGVVRAEAAVISREGPRGKLVVELSLASLAAERAVVFRSALVVGLGTLVSGSLAAWLIAHSVARRVKRLAIATARVAAGDFASRVGSDPSNDELGQLARAFEHMVTSIQSLVAQVADQGKRENERLEVMVAARTEELAKRNEAKRRVLDHVAQGLVTVDADGVMSSERSRVLDTWLPTPTVGMTFGDYIAQVDGRAGLAFARGWAQASEGVLPLDLVLDQLPRLMRRGDQHLELRYTLVSSDPESPSLLVVVSDVTAELEQKRAEEGERDFATLFARVLVDRTAVAEFFTEASDLLKKIDGGPTVPSEVRMRALHTLKGNANLMGLRAITRKCHDLEDRLLEAGDAGEDLRLEERGAETEPLRRAWRPLEEACATLLGSDDRMELSRAEHAALLQAARTATRAEWRRQLEALTFEPVERRLARISDQARTLAERLGKPGLVVHAQSHGLRLPPARWAPFWSAFGHVVRNAVDHGVEPPAERVATGKAPQGELRLSTGIAGDELVVELSDDGRGIDWDAVALRARQQGCPSAAEGDLEAVLFSDGVSTRDDVSDVSGRGVGLGAVRDACEALGGRIAVTSERRRGTTFSFHFPMARTGCMSGSNVDAPASARRPSRAPAPPVPRIGAF